MTYESTEFVYLAVHLLKNLVLVLKFRAKYNFTLQKQLFPIFFAVNLILTIVNLLTYSGVVVANVWAAAPNAPAVQRQLLWLSGGAERAGGGRRRDVGRPQAPIRHQPHPAAAGPEPAASHAAPRHSALGTSIRWVALCVAAPGEHKQLGAIVSKARSCKFARADVSLLIERAFYMRGWDSALHNIVAKANSKGRRELHCIG